MRIKIAILLTFIFLISCKTDPNKEIDKGKITEDSYYCEEVGWSIKIPKGWRVTQRTEMDKRLQKGLEAINESTGSNFQDLELTYLLSFQKGDFNLFQSNFEPVELDPDENGEDLSNTIKQMIYSMYEDRGIQADSSKTKIINVDGLDFHSYMFTIYDPEGEIFLNQIVYNRLINGLNFSVNINYNNEADKQELLRAWLSSKFQK